MSARETILNRLRETLEQPALPFPQPDPPRILRGHHLTVQPLVGDLPTLATRFGEELEKVGGTYDIAHSMSAARLLCVSHLIEWMEEDDNARKGMVLETGQEKSILGWAPDTLGVDGLGDALEAMALATITPEELRSEESRNSVRYIRYGLTGVTAACAATGTMIMASSMFAGTSRSASLLPFRHLALIPYSCLYPHFEAWIAEQRSSDSLTEFMRNNANISLITGPSKSADLDGALTLGVHGPKYVHAILFDDSVASL